MLRFIFLLGMIMLMCSLINFAIKAAWSIGKIIFAVVLFPIALICMASVGLVQLSLGLLAMGIIISTMKTLTID